MHCSTSALLCLNDSSSCELRYTMAKAFIATKYLLKELPHVHLMEYYIDIKEFIKTWNNTNVIFFK